MRQLAASANWRANVPAKATGRRRYDGEGAVGVADYVVISVLLLLLCEPYFVSTRAELVASIVLIPVIGVAVPPRGEGRTRIPGLVVAMCLLLVVSSAWSTDTVYTLLLALTYAAFAVTAAMIAARLPLSDLNHIASLVLLLFSVACVALAIVAPSVGRDSELHAGALQGFFQQKNLFAYAMLIGLITALCDSRWNSGQKVLAGVWYAGLIFLADSSTALVVGVCALGTLALLRPVSGSAMWRLWLPYIGLVGCFSAGIMLTNLDQLSEVLGRDATLTGRTTIWHAVWTNITEHPWTGTGWGTAWRDGDIAGDEIRAYIGGYISHAHNGILDVWLQVGVFGALIIVFMLGQLLVASVTRIADDGRNEFRWLSALAVVLVLYSVDETRATKLLGWWLIAAGLCYATASRSTTPGVELADGGSGLASPDPPPLSKWPTLPGTRHGSWWPPDPGVAGREPSRTGR